MKYSVIIAAAGKGSRTELPYNKILYAVNGKMMIEYTLDNFIYSSSCEKIILVINKDDEQIIKNKIKSEKVVIVYGGTSREQSVYNGLKLVKSDYVLIHDADRPNVSNALIDKVLQALSSNDSVIPIIKKNDSINKYGKELDDYLIQTPQGFKTSLLKDAFCMVTDFSKYQDDASILESISGIKPTLIKGEKINLKITDKDDLKYIGEDKN